jgi:hypothetical protein
MISQAFPSGEHSRVVNSDGWTVPGINWVKSSAGPRADQQIVIKNRTVTLETFTNFNGPISSTAGRVPFIFVGQDEVNFRQLNVKVLRLERYSYEGKPFCYHVTVAPYDFPKHGPGGVWASSFELAYYDDDATGKFRTLEYPDPIVRAGRSAIKVRLARWIEPKTER